MAVSVNLAAAAGHKGPHPGAHHGMSVAVEEVQQQRSKAGKKHHKGNGGKHDSGVDGHHPGYDMSVPSSVAKSSKGKAQKASKALSHSMLKSSTSTSTSKSKSAKAHSKSKSAKAHSLSMRTSSSKAAKSMSFSPTSTTTTVAPIDPTTPAEEPADTTPIPDSIPIPETLPAPAAPEGADTAVLKVIERDGPADVVLTGGKGSQQSKIKDEKSVNLQGQEQASMMSETKNAASVAIRAGVVAGVACLFASASYWIV